MRKVFPFLIGCMFLMNYLLGGILDGTWIPFGLLIIGLLFLGWALTGGK